MSTAESDISPTHSPPTPADGTAGALEGLVVVERAEGIAGPLCGKLMAGFGAEVIKVEPPSGDVSRTLGPFRDDVSDPEASGLFLYLNAGKKSVVVDASNPSHRQRLRELIDRADVLIDGPPGLDTAGLGYLSALSNLPVQEGGELSPANPDLVVVSITPFGLSGPYRDFAATNLVVHALSGELGLAGSRHLPPLKKGGNLADYHAGCHGFIGAVAALLARDRLGGQHVEVSHLESLTSILGATMNGWLYNEKVSQRGEADPWSLGTAARRGEDGTHWEPSGVWKARDGYVLAYGRSSADWTGAIREMSEDLPDLASTRFTTEEGRGEHAEELTRLFGRWVSEHTKEEVYRLAQRYGHAYGYVATARDLLESPQLRHRRFFVRVRHPVAGSVTMPGAPFRMSRTPFVSRRAPLLGEHDGSSLPPRGERMGRSDGHEEGRLPLEGLRVVDFTHIWAGPYCTRILADLGAEVIKVESPRRGDGGRGKGVGRYHAYSRNKLAIAIDLRTDEGQRHIRKLISMSDVVAENFSVGVTRAAGRGLRGLPGDHAEHHLCRAARIREDRAGIRVRGHGRHAGGDVGPAGHQQLPGRRAEPDGGEVRRPQRRPARSRRRARRHPPPGRDRGGTADRPVAARGQHLYPSRAGFGLRDEWPDRRGRRRQTPRPRPDGVIPV